MKAIVVAGIAIQVWALLGAAPARADDPVAGQAGVVEEMQEAGPQTAPVELDGEVLFWVVGAKSYPAPDRARAIRGNIVALARDPAVQPETVQTIDDKFATRIVSGERPIMHVVDAAARIEGLTPAYEGDPAEPKIVPKERWHTLPAEGRAEGGARPGQSPIGNRPKGDDRH